MRQQTTPTRSPILSVASSPVTGSSRRTRFRIRSVTLRLYDTRRGGLHPFEPIPGRDRVGLYVCGVTPYDTGHLGHAFTYVSFDVLHRYLEYLGHDVVYVQNLTDVDDDMLRKARETGEDYLALGNRWVDDLPDRDGRPQLAAARPPAARDAARAADDRADRAAARRRARVRGRRATSTSASRPIRRFGEVSHVPRDEMLAIANERGNVPDMPGKRDPLDFVLWQRSLPDEPLVGVAVGSGAARLAHRVFRDVDDLPRQPLRDPRRRRRPGRSPTTRRSAPSPRAPPASGRSSRGGCTPGMLHDERRRR